EAEDRVNGLEQGADDYLAKPFEPRELVLRIRNILQRRPAADGAEDAVRFGAFRFDRGRGELSRGGDSVHLTAAEAGLLAILAQRAGEPVSREELSQAAPLSGNIRNVDVQMTRLRRKIERDPRYPRYLQTVRGTGYVLKPESERRGGAAGRRGRAGGRFGAGQLRDSAAPLAQAAVAARHVRPLAAADREAPGAGPH